MSRAIVNYDRIPYLVRDYLRDRHGLTLNRWSATYDVTTLAYRFRFGIIVGDQIMTIQYSVADYEFPSSNQTKWDLVAHIGTLTYDAYIKEVDKMADEFMKEGK